MDIGVVKYVDDSVLIREKEAMVVSTFVEDDKVDCECYQK